MYALCNKLHCEWYSPPPPLPPRPQTANMCVAATWSTHANQIWSAFSNPPQYSLWLFGLVLEPRSQDVAILIVFIQNTAQTLKYNYLVSVAYRHAQCPILYQFFSYHKDPHSVDILVDRGMCKYPS